MPGVSLDYEYIQQLRNNECLLVNPGRPIHKEDAMGNEFTGFEDNTPTLTLEPVLDEPKAEVTVQPEVEAVKKEMEQTVLSPEEQQMVDSFAKKIDIENTSQILQYGAGTQKKMADFSDAALENVRTQDLGEVGDLITQVVG